jgi:AmmeMemoRadiSam system protein A
MRTEGTAELTRDERDFLLQLALRAIVERAESGTTAAVDDSELTPALRSAKGCFVTLTQRGELRGCIGNLTPEHPLFLAVIQNACGAAFRDVRFEPVTREEARDLKIGISVLTEPATLAFSSPGDLLRKLRPGVDGVVLNVGGRTATYLPKVWEKIPDPENFMESLTGKARLPISAWQATEAVVLTYQVESFEADRP